MVEVAVIYGFASVVLISLVSFVGAVILITRSFLHKVVLYFVAFAAGALFGDVFLHIIPEVFSELSSERAGIAVLIGVSAFFVLEKILRWYHVHDLEESKGVHFSPHVGYLNLFSDALHNFIDGVFIAASYSVSIPTGIATTLAVIFHEIPQEIGDIGILIHAGFSRKKALFFNFISATSAIVGFLFATFFLTILQEYAIIVLAVTGGTFVYLAGSDLVPELHRTRNVKTSLLQLCAFILGMAVMYSLLLVE